jgi:hypothetical protein
MYFEPTLKWNLLLLFSIFNSSNFKSILLKSFMTYYCQHYQVYIAYYSQKGEFYCISIFPIKIRGSDHPLNIRCLFVHLLVGKKGGGEGVVGVQSKEIGIVSQTETDGLMLSCKHRAVPPKSIIYELTYRHAHTSVFILYPFPSLIFTSANVCFLLIKYVPCRENGNG